METPWKVSSNRVKIAENDDYLWERVSESPDERGLNEAPQILRDDNRVYLIYSASGSWQPSYRLGQLSIPAHDDPMVPSHWTVYHTKIDTVPGWRRVVHEKRP